MQKGHSQNKHIKHRVIKALFYLGFAFSYLFLGGHIVRYFLGEMGEVPGWIRYVAILVMYLPVAWLTILAFPFPSDTNDKNREQNVIMGEPACIGHHHRAMLIRSILLVATVGSLVFFFVFLATALAGAPDSLRASLALGVCLCQFADAVISYSFPQIGRKIPSNSLFSIIRRASLFGDVNTQRNSTLAVAILFGFLAIALVIYLLRDIR